MRLVKNGNSIRNPVRIDKVVMISSIERRKK